jgi:hypothetical protein
MLREAGRQGVLPFATFWSRVGRFKTPYGPLLLKWVLSMFLVIATPAGDTFAFLVDLSGYPGLVRLRCTGKNYTQLTNMLGIRIGDVVWCLDFEKSED